MNSQNTSHDLKPSSARKLAQDSSINVDQYATSLGLDWFSFQTSIRKLVMELIEPTVKKAHEDHETVGLLTTNYDKLRKRQEDFEFSTVKTLTRTASLEDLAKKHMEFEKARMKMEEKLWSEISKLLSNQEFIRDKVSSFLQEAHTFSKLVDSLQFEIQDMERQIQNNKHDLSEQIMKEMHQLHYKNEDVKGQMHQLNESLGRQKVTLEGFNQQIIKQNVQIHHFENKLDDILMEAKDYTNSQSKNQVKSLQDRIQDLKDIIAEETRFNLKNFKLTIMRDLMGHDLPEQQIEGFHVPSNWITDPIEFKINYKSKSPLTKTRKIPNPLLKKFRKSENDLNKITDEQQEPVEEEEKEDKDADPDLYDIMESKSQHNQVDDNINLQYIDLDDVRTLVNLQTGSVQNPLEKTNQISQFKEQMLEERMGTQENLAAQLNLDTQANQQYKNSQYQQSMGGQMPKIDKSKKQIMSLEQIWSYVKQQMKFYFDNNQDIISQINRRIETVKVSDNKNEFINGTQSDVEPSLFSKENPKDFLLNKQMTKTLQSPIQVQDQLPLNQQQTNTNLSLNNTFGAMNQQLSKFAIPQVSPRAGQINGQIDQQAIPNQTLSILSHNINSPSTQLVGNNFGAALGGFKFGSKLGTQQSQPPLQTQNSFVSMGNNNNIQPDKAMSSEIVQQFLTPIQDQIKALQEKYDKVMQSYSNLGKTLKQQKQEKPKDYSQDINKLNESLTHTLEKVDQIKEEILFQIDSQVSQGQQEIRDNFKFFKNDINTRQDEDKNEIEKKLHQQYQRLNETISKIKISAPSQAVSSSNASQLMNQDLVPQGGLQDYQVEIMLTNSRQEMLDELQSELSRLQTKVTTQLTLDCNSMIKEELKFWSDNLKKELHYEVGQLSKEVRNKNSHFDSKFSEFDSKIQEISQIQEQQKLKTQMDKTQTESFQLINNDQNNQEMTFQRDGNSQNKQLGSEAINERIQQIENSINQIMDKFQLEMPRIQSQLVVQSQKVDAVNRQQVQISREFQNLKNVQLRQSQSSQLQQNSVPLQTNHNSQATPKSPNKDFRQSQGSLLMDEQRKSRLNSQKSIIGGEEEVVQQFEEDFQIKGLQFSSPDIQVLDSRVQQLEEQIGQILSKFPVMEEQMAQLTVENINQYIVQSIDMILPQKDIQNMHAQMKAFNINMKESLQFLEDKMKILENLESELESGVKRNARDKTDYLLQIKAIQTNVERQLQQFKDQLAEHLTQIDLVNSQTVDNMLNKSGDKEEDNIYQLNQNSKGRMSDVNNLNDEMRHTTLMLETEAGDTKTDDTHFGSQFMPKKESKFNLKKNSNKQSLILPSVNKPSYPQLNSNFQGKSNHKRVHSSEAVGDFNYNNSQMNLASVKNLLNEHEKSKLMSYLANQKTKTLLHQNPIHNYSQILDPLEMLKEAKRKQNISMDLIQNPNQQSKQGFDTHTQMPVIKQALNLKNLSNNSSILQINTDKINWENVKIRDSQTNRANSQMVNPLSNHIFKNHFKEKDLGSGLGGTLYQIHSEQTSPIRLQALVGQTPKEKASILSQRAYKKIERSTQQLHD